MKIKNNFIGLLFNSRFAFFADPEVSESSEHLDDEDALTDLRKEVDAVSNEQVKLSPSETITMEAYEKVGEVARDLVHYLLEAAGKKDRWYKTHDRIRAVEQIGEEQVEKAEALGLVIKTAECLVNTDELSEITIHLQHTYNNEGELKAVRAEFPLKSRNDLVPYLSWMNGTPTATNPIPGSDWEEYIGNSEKIIDACKKSIE